MPSSHHSAAADASDIQQGFIACLPVSLRALALLSRWDRPIGIYLLFWPAAWGLVLAAGGAPSLPLLLAFFVGAVTMRGAGCTINDILDRQLDSAVARTAQRPLPAGLISLRGAWLWLALQLLVAACILFALPSAVWLWGVAAVPLVLLYPLMKRVTWWPQLWLGMTFNWGLFLGAAAHGAVPGATALCLYAGAVFWTLGYDTIYATQDAEDDARVGVKSTARLFGTAVQQAVAACYMLATACWAVAGMLGGLHPLYFLALLPVGALLAWQFRLWSRKGPRAAFVFNKWVGMALAMALAVGYLAA